MKLDERLSVARSVLASALNLTPEAIGDAAVINGLENWDSLGHMRLVLEIEQRLRRELSPTEIVELASLSDVHRLLSASEKG